MSGAGHWAMGGAWSHALVRVSSPQSPAKGTREIFLCGDPAAKSSGSRPLAEATSQTRGPAAPKHGSSSPNLFGLAAPNAWGLLKECGPTGPEGQEPSLPQFIPSSRVWCPPVLGLVARRFLGRSPASSWVGRPPTLGLVARRSKIRRNPIGSAMRQILLNVCFNEIFEGTRVPALMGLTAVRPAPVYEIQMCLKASSNDAVSV